MSRSWVVRDYVMRAVTALVALIVLAAPARGQGFGSQVAISGEEILIAQPLDQGDPATILRYGLSGGEWRQTGTLQASPEGDDADYFGRLMIVDGESMIVGGTLYQQSTGAVWSYRRSGSEWEVEQVLQPDSLTAGEAFGRFGDLGDDLLFVSSLGFRGFGAVWVFERDAQGQWSEQARLDPADPVPEEFFGWDVAYDSESEKVIVGSLAGQSQSPGAAYVFSRDVDGRWRQEVRLALPESESRQGDAAAGNGPGNIGVGWFQGMALLGLPGRDGGEGAVYAYRPQPVTGDWVREATLSAFDRRPGATFGDDFHIHEGELWISAPGEGVGGSIYRFTYDAATETFRGASKISNTIDSDASDWFGSAIATSGDLAAIGQPGDDNGFGSVIVMRGREGEWVSEAKLLIPSEPGLPAIMGRELECADAGTVDAFPCSNVDLLSFLPVADIGGTRGTATNDIWGWTDPETRREYAIIGRTDGTGFVDITDPVNPRYLGNLPKTRGARSNAWRGIKVYANHAFIVADGAGSHGMQVFDLTRLREVSVPQTFDAELVYEGVASVHTIAINEETGTAYLAGSNSGGEACSGGLHMVDVNEPTNPEFVGCFAHPNTGRAGTGYTHETMCIIYRGPDQAHAGREICFSANETALSIADVTDKANPIALAAATYPNVGYAHQGWITEDHRWFFMNDELDEGAAERQGGWPGTRTLIWDVSDLDDPVMVKEHFGETFTTDHNLYIVGNLMYQSNYVSGLRILNIADPMNPFEVGFFDTVPDNESTAMSGSWSNYPFFESGTIAVASRREGVFFVRFSPTELLP